MVVIIVYIAAIIVINVVTVISITVIANTIYDLMTVIFIICIIIAIWFIFSILCVIFCFIWPLSAIFWILVCLFYVISSIFINFYYFYTAFFIFFISISFLFSICLDSRYHLFIFRFLLSIFTDIYILCWIVLILYALPVNLSFGIVWTAICGCLGFNSILRSIWLHIIIFFIRQCILAIHSFQTICISVINIVYIWFRTVRCTYHMFLSIVLYVWLSHRCTIIWYPPMTRIFYSRGI